MYYKSGNVSKHKILVHLAKLKNTQIFHIHIKVIFKDLSNIFNAIKKQLHNGAGMK